jgi:hypothetical protein
MPLLQGMQQALCRAQQHQQSQMAVSWLIKNAGDCEHAYICCTAHHGHVAAHRSCYYRGVSRVLLLLLRLRVLYAYALQLLLLLLPPLLHIMHAYLGWSVLPSRTGHTGANYAGLLSLLLLCLELLIGWAGDRRWAHALAVSSSGQRRQRQQAADRNINALHDVGFLRIKGGMVKVGRGNGVSQ